MANNRGYEDGFTPFAAGILTRVSTVMQRDDGISLEVQEAELRQVAERMKLPLPGGPLRNGVYCDAAESGDLFFTRTGLQQAIADMKAGVFNVLLVRDQSRLSWSRENMPKIVREITNAGGRIYIEKLGAFLDPDDYTQGLQTGIMTEVDRFYRMHFRAESIAAKRELTSQGIQAFRSYFPYGYRIVTRKDVLSGRDGEEALGRYIILPEQAAVVRRAYNLYAQDGLSLRAICTIFNDEGIPTPRGGKGWVTSVLSRLFANTTYAGTVCVFKTKRLVDETRIGQKSDHSGRTLISKAYFCDAPVASQMFLECPAIVTKEIWEQAQTRLKENKAILSPHPESRYLLAGILYCPICGILCTARSKAQTGYAVYRCRHHAPRACPPGVEVCNNRSYGMERVHEFVISCFQFLATRSDVLEEAISSWRESQEREAATFAPESIEFDRAALKQQIEALEARSQEVAIMDGIAPGFRAATLRDLSAKWQVATTKIAALDAQQSTRKVNHALRLSTADYTKQATAACIAAERVLTDSRIPTEYKRNILRGLIERVVPVNAVQPEGKKKRSVAEPEAVDVFFKAFAVGVACISIRATRAGIHSIEIIPSHPILSSINALAPVEASLASTAPARAKGGAA